MDGNSRWAKKAGKKKIFGYEKGFQAVKTAIHFSLLKNVKILTLYAFSTENWSRPISEIQELMQLFFILIDTQIRDLHKNNICFRVLGNISNFDVKLQESIKKAEKLTINNNGLILNIAANYSGKWDIIEGVKKIFNQVQQGLLTVDQIKEKNFNKY
ncbi:di-trans,poly-cis-decaprenylcistransferase, partial [Buchnera aphidicola]|nr:di-trans,poly-cis-decaprenylcistransferase [Buchnera aphidicola]